jgi:hypothetical protein
MEKNQKIQLGLKTILIVLLIALLAALPIIAQILLCKKHFSTDECIYDYLKYWQTKISGSCYIKEYHQKGVPNESLNILLDVYVIESQKKKVNLTNEEISSIISLSSKVWEDYGIKFEINKIERFEVEDEHIISVKKDEKLRELSLFVAKDRLYCNEDKIIDVFIFPDLRDRILFLEFNSIEGKGLRSFSNKDCINLIIIDSRSNRLDWVIAHEMGHILGLLDYDYFSGQFNLMTNSGCIRDEFYPTVLNQKQVDTSLATAKSFV